MAQYIRRAGRNVWLSFFSNMHLISNESAIADASSVIQLNPIRSLDLGDVIGIFSSVFVFLDLGDVIGIFSSVFVFSSREYSGLYDRKEDAKKLERNDKHPKSAVSLG